MYETLEVMDTKIMQNFSMKKMLDDLGSIQNNFNLEAFEEYVEVLIRINNDDYSTILEDSNAQMLDECIKWAIAIIAELSPGSATKQIIFRKFLFLFSLQKLNFSSEDFESIDLILSIIDNGLQIIKLCIDNDYLNNIDYFICQSLNSLDKLENVSNERTLPKIFDQKHIVLYKRTSIILYKVEKMIKENRFQETLLELTNQKVNVLNLNVFKEYFIGLCYNFSLKCKQEKYFDIALTALLTAYEVCKTEEYQSTIMKKTNYFLVHICLEYNEKENWHHAVNALNLSCRNDIDIFYIMSKLKIAFISQKQEYLDVIDEAVKWKNIQIEHAIEIVDYLQKHGQSARAGEFIWKLKQKSFSNNDKFLLLKKEIQLCISQNDARVFSLIENAIDISKGGVSTSSITSLCKLLLFHSGIKLKENMIKDSLALCKLCTLLCEADNNIDKSLFHHVLKRLCLCYVELAEWDLAKDIFSRLTKKYFEPDSLYTYLALQIAFMFNDEILVTETLTMNDGRCNNVENILLSCCYKMYSTGKKDFVFKILEAVLVKYNSSDGSILLVRISQCLIGLSAKSSGNKDTRENCLLYLDKAFSALQNNLEHPDFAELNQWFSQAAWNLALTPNIEPSYRFDFFLRCCCFSELSVKNMTRLKNALMLTAASGLHLVRQMNSEGKTDSLDRENILRKVLTVIEKCRSLEKGSNVTLLRLLHLYEFEAKCHTGEWKDRAENLKEVLRLPFMDVKTVEHIAAIANEFMPSNYKIIIEALKVAVQKITEREFPNTADASKTYHSLLQVMFYAQEYYAPSMEEESLLLCEKLLKLIGTVLENYPQLEILWLMTKCWNWGIRKLTLNDTKRAHRWCTIAMAFLDKLDSLKSLHEKELQNMYLVYFPDGRNSKGL